MQYRKFPLYADFKGLFLGIHGKRGCQFGDSKTRAVLLSKSGGCSLAVGTQPQRVSDPPPPPPRAYAVVHIRGVGGRGEF